MNGHTLSELQRLSLTRPVSLDLTRDLEAMSPGVSSFVT